MKKIIITKSDNNIMRSDFTESIKLIVI